MSPCRIRSRARVCSLQVFWTIRAVLAPLLEGLLLLDRTLFLVDECNCGAWSCLDFKPAVTFPACVLTCWLECDAWPP